VSLEVYVERAVRGALGDTDTIVDHIDSAFDDASRTATGWAQLEDRLGHRAVNEGFTADCATDLHRGYGSRLDGLRRICRSAVRSDGKDRDGSKGEKPQKGSRAVE